MSNKTKTDFTPQELEDLGFVQVTEPKDGTLNLHTIYWELVGTKNYITSPALVSSDIYAEHKDLTDSEKESFKVSVERLGESGDINLEKINKFKNHYGV